jgi:hypothetical protein
MDAIDFRLFELAVLRDEITADDITSNGTRAVDGTHKANGRQSSIGSHFQKWHKQGLIEPTGRVVKSKAPHRKGGMIQIWRILPETKRLAYSVLDR